MYLLYDPYYRMIHDLDFATWLGQDLKLVNFDITTNSYNSASILDCFLANDSLKVHVQGNSMLSMGLPFSIGYEATFENTLPGPSLAFELTNSPSRQ